MDDDYDNYSNDEEFHEDSLTNEEYDALYAALPKVKAELSSYNPQIEDLDIKEALYYNYFEVSAALEELKSKFPKKKEEPAPPKLSKLAMLAKSRAGSSASDQKKSLDLSGFSRKQPDFSKTDSSKTDSSQNTCDPSSSEKVSSLARLAKTRVSSTAEETRSQQQPNFSKLSSLARLKRETAPELSVNGQSSEPRSSKTQLLRKTNGGGSELRKRLENAKKSQAKGEAKTAEPAATDSVTPIEIDSDSNFKECTASQNGKRMASGSHLSFELMIDQSALLPEPQNCVSVLLFETAIDSDHALHRAELVNKRRRLSNQIFTAYTNKTPSTAKAKSNFSSPSPDDKVLNAQKQAFEQSVKELSIKDDAAAQSASKAPSSKQTATKPFKKIDVRQELAKNPHFIKPNESFVIIGHVDAGKSTLMGRILYDLGAVDAKTVNKLVREAEKSGKGSFALAWVMDQTTEERSRGVTIDICATTFETESTRFTAIDAPGHKDFVPQMIGGVSQADTALLVVDSVTGEFEAGFLMDGQTKEHAIIARSLGVRNLCVAVNKMDKENWSQARFEDIKEQLGQFLTGEEIGFSSEDMSFVPISGLTGCNVVKPDHATPELSWYTGPTLIERLEQIGHSSGAQTPIETVLSSDFNMAINDIYDVSGSEFKVKGKVSSGSVQAGESVCMHPTEDTLQVQAVLYNGEVSTVAVEGQIVSLVFKVNQLKNKSTDDLAIGDIVSGLTSAVRSVSSFRAAVNTFNMSKPLLVGTPFVLFRNNASVAARITKVVKVNGAKKKKMHLVSRQNAEVVIEVLEDRKLPVAQYADNKALGRVVLRREGVTIGAGMITKIEE